MLRSRCVVYFDFKIVPLIIIQVKEYHKLPMIASNAQVYVHHYTCPLSVYDRWRIGLSHENIVELKFLLNKK